MPVFLIGEGVKDLASVLITGASGMIGMYLTSALLKKKHRVFGVDIKSNEFIGADPNYTFIQCDANDKDRITDAIKSNNIDTVVHLAYTVDNDLDQYITDLELKNSKATDKFIYAAARDARVKNFILASSTVVYGLQKGREPIRETQAEKGNSNYAELKLLSEKLLQKEFKKGDVISVIMRIAPVYTSEYTQNLLDRVYDAKEDVAFIFNEGDYGFKFCCVFNVVDFICAIIAGPQGRYEGIYNICDTKITTAKEIIDHEREHHRIGAVVQRSPNMGLTISKSKAKTDYRYFDPSNTFMNWNYDNTKAQRISPFRWNLGNTK